MTAEETREAKVWCSENIDRIINLSSAKEKRLQIPKTRNEGCAAGSLTEMTDHQHIRMLSRNTH